MTKPIVLDTTHAFRAHAGTEAPGTAMPRPEHHDDAPMSGAFTRQELRDLVLHWMG